MCVCGEGGRAEQDRLSRRGGVCVGGGGGYTGQAVKERWCVCVGVATQDRLSRRGGVCGGGGWLHKTGCPGEAVCVWGGEGVNSTGCPAEVVCAGGGGGVGGGYTVQAVKERCCVCVGGGGGWLNSSGCQGEAVCVGGGGVATQDRLSRRGGVCVGGVATQDRLSRRGGVCVEVVCMWGGGELNRTGCPGEVVCACGGGWLHRTGCPGEDVWRVVGLVPVSGSGMGLLACA